MDLTFATPHLLRRRSANNSPSNAVNADSPANSSLLRDVVKSKISVVKILSALKLARLSITDNTVEGVHGAVKAKHTDIEIVNYYIDGEEIENSQTLRYFQSIDIGFFLCVKNIIADFFAPTPGFAKSVAAADNEKYSFCLDFKNIAVVIRAGFYMNEVRAAMVHLGEKKMLTDETRLAIQLAGKDAVNYARQLTSRHLEVSKPELDRRNNKFLLFKRAKYSDGLHSKKLNIVAPEQVIGVLRITGG